MDFGAFNGRDSRDEREKGAKWAGPLASCMGTLGGYMGYMGGYIGVV